jgi:hypothetical protein
MATYTDTFDRANETPLAAPWVASTGVDLINNEVFRTGGSPFVRLDDNFTPAQSSTMTVTFTTNSGIFGPAVRMNALRGCYYIYNNLGADLAVRKRDDYGNETTLLQFGGLGLATGDSLTLDITAGNVLSVLKNGVQVNSSVTDTENLQPNGSAGFYLNTTSNVAVTSFTSEGQTTADTIPPVITRVGLKKVNVPLNGTYTDEGATATDNTEGDITGNIVTVNPVNTAVAGEYTVTYNVSDTAGNAAKTITRLVSVVDLATTFIDDFNRPNEAPLAAPWEQVTAGVTAGRQVTLVDNEIKASGSGFLAAVITGELFADDQSAEIVLRQVDTGGYIGLILRGDTLGNGYLLEYRRNGDDLRVYSLVDGTQTQLTFYSNIRLNDGKVFKASVTGNVLRIFVNGVQVGTEYVDTTNAHTSGAVGLWLGSNQGREFYDNFMATGISQAPEISRVDDDNTVTDGQQDVPVVVSGFTGDITSASLRVGANTIALTDLVKIS